MKVHNTSGRLWIEEGEQREGVVAEVAPILRTHKTYSYAVPPEIENGLTLGRRVSVPLGRKGKPVQGFVVKLDRKRWDHTLRPIETMIDPASYLTENLIELGRQIALHYASPLGRTLKAMTPEGVRKQRGLKSIRYVKLAKSPDEIHNEQQRITAKRLAIIDALASTADPVPVDQLLGKTKVTSTVLRSMEKIGLVTITIRKEEVEHAEPAIPLIEPDFQLNDEQQNALSVMYEAIQAEQFSVTLLQGVSGCGKTEVYIHAIRRVLKNNQQAILLISQRLTIL